MVHVFLHSPPIQPRNKTNKTLINNQTNLNKHAMKGNEVVAQCGSDSGEKTKEKMTNRYGNCTTA
jgi:hypothetical protein